MTRPLAPSLPASHAVFVPDQDGLGAWAVNTFISPGSPLTNPEHDHLRAARIGWLWTNVPVEVRGRRLAGECRMPRSSGALWSQWMGVHQLEQWFAMVPDFLITIDATLARDATDEQFCALVEHELYHAGQERDEFGAPKFKRSGDPVFAMRGHDVEQFVGVVERYGADATGVRELVEAANRGPVLQDGVVPLVCGTCARKAA